MIHKYKIIFILIIKISDKEWSDINLLKSTLIIIVFCLCKEVVYASSNNFDKPDLRIIIDKELVNENNNVIFIDNEPYVSLRNYIEHFGGKVVWNKKNQNVIVINGAKVFNPKTVIRDNTSYMPLGNLNTIFGYNIKYFKQYNIIIIDTKSKSTDLNNLYEILPSYKNYTKDDLNWLSKIIDAEAKGEPYKSKIIVGNVIINRKNNKMYPNTIKDVIFDNKNGIQFTPTIDGSINNTPSFESFLSALEVLEGKRTANNVLFFMNSEIATTAWISNNRPFAFSMDSHDFFY